MLGGVPGTYTYALDERLRDGAVAGRRVEVPLGNTPRVGVLLQLHERALTEVDERRLKPVTRLLDDGPLVPPPVLTLCRWAASYYAAPLSLALRAALPPGASGEDDTGWELTEAGRHKLADEPPAAQLALYGAGEPSKDEDTETASRPLPEPLALQRVAEGRWASVARPQLARLAKAGLLARTHRLDPGAAEPMVAVAVRTGPEQNPVPLHHRVRHAVYEALMERSPVAVDVLAAIAPSARQAVAQLERRGWVRQEQRPRAAITAQAPRDGSAPQLTADQQVVVHELEQALDRAQSGAEPQGRTFLLEGVTGSGKTEVYLQLVSRALEQGAQALVMVPEIALTPQLAGRFAGRFGERVAVLHSGLSDRDRATEWHRIRRGEAPVVVGARSAIFAPLEQPAVIVVDEEHDGSFKQESGLRYHGRDLAVVRGRQAGAVVVLGSATPSLESLHNVERGRYGHVRLPRRVIERPMPAVEMIDLRGRRRGAPELGVAPSGLLSEQAIAALQEVVARGEQAIVFLNRRGHSTALLCRDCGEVARCDSCAVSLTYHDRRRTLACHYCGLRAPLPDVCRHCGSARLLLTGAGTEKLEAELSAALPTARLLRLDRDSAPRARPLEAILGRFARREADVLVGTQMVTKGHDFPGVTLVVVLLADAALHQPDFRAAERTAQLLTQVAGRAGRAEQPGRVLVQTFCPEAPAVAAVQGHDYAAFARQELLERAEVGYPPYCRLALLRAEGADDTAVQQAVERAAQQLRTIDGLRLLGPSPAPLARLRDLYRHQLLLRAESHGPLDAAARLLEPLRRALGTAVQLGIDIDPVEMM